MHDSGDFGPWLRQLRRTRDLTQEALARAALCSLDTVKKLEAGRRRPSRQLADQLANALELDMRVRATFLAAARRSDEPYEERSPGGVTPHSLPVQLTPFIGREAELTALATLLDAPQGRLVNLIGPGGIGKTRIALALAERLIAQGGASLPQFPDGVAFVPLQTVNSAEQIVSAIGDALHCSLASAADSRERLLTYLQPRRLLLVLDAFEHLRDHAALLGAILTRAPGIMLLVTSREALNLAAEWRYPIEGFSLPPETALHDLGQPDAVRLFVTRAQRARPQFELAEEAADVLRICRLVEGSPLAIELAAAWVTTLSCGAIADEILSNHAFLSSGRGGVPQRHRSMRAVFDASWARLDEDERQVFARLSVFRGGFQRETAAHVAGATLTTLRELVDKSLLRREPGGRYQIHELLRQYAVEQLEASGDATEARERHAAYFTDFVAQRAADVAGRRQRAALQEIAAELENVRAAWQHALDQRHVHLIRQAAYTFYLFLDYRSHFQEGVACFAEAVDRLEQDTSGQEVAQTLAELLVCLGWPCIRVGELERAGASLERSQRLLARFALAPNPGPGTDPLTALGTLACVQGDYAEAARLGELARQHGEARADEGNLMYAYYVLTSAAFALGQYAEARRAGEHACALAERTQDRWFLAYLVANLGHIARATGNYPEALHHYTLSYELREEYTDPEGMAAARSHLGQIALLQQDPSTAAAQFARSLELYRTIDDRGGIATALEGMGRSEVAAGSYAVAAQHFQEALRVAATIRFVPRVHAILVGIAELMLGVGREAQAARLLVALIRHPASDQETVSQARSVLRRCARGLGPEAYAAATQGRQMLDVDAIVADLQAAVGQPALDHGGNLWPAPQPRHLHHSAVELLTERELAVLRLIAEGCANREISERLVLSLGTTKWYVSQILGKLGVQSRTQALLRARELGLLT
jgi:predicted ATPase/DNA-binding NarL/FixJ family response regulator/DNA-binding XRE family transcriptional regulator